ncbi:uncharacterized protein B0P05DRAFT_469698 [Gilbertella persicaria]|uniref:uncharacterized protein n=1 Tax=Gilbertella persicaria TaxID=101096 RepID=UPI00222013EC|nr:uncharacterized protein B0P05DRAFT_469698 [Gilbertella persicaria]KAI8079539.1 hypothetical protein B0P05DRAFT_469698 [Gilbertella persicaria]
MLPPNKSEQQSEMPDLSNPYMYPSNPIASTKEQNYPVTNSTFNHAQSSDVDPELTRFKSLFWKKAGELQSTLGSLTGLTSWQQSGEKTREEAEREHKEAQERLGHGEASRIHGEYDRLMGYVTYAVGHVAGDNEMQMKANERTERGAAEINRSLHS